MSDTNEPSVTPVEGIQGNTYEDMPLEWEYTAADKAKEQAAKAAGTGQDLDKAAAAQSAIDAGGAASLEHGKKSGAMNALTFHNFDKDKDKDT